MVLDLLSTSSLLRRHIGEGAVCFGINHEMRDFVHDRKKNLDLVLCTPNGSPQSKTFADIAAGYGIQLTAEEHRILNGLPVLQSAPVGSVLIALEAKACMTAHQRALPRLYDELNSSHATVHGASEQALAVGFAMVNLAVDYLSPDLNKQNFPNAPVWSKHAQPRAAELAIDKIKQLPRRSHPNENGYDGLAIVVIDMPNDGSAAHLISQPPAPKPGEIYHYDSMITRIAGLYATRFKDLT